MYFTKKQTIVEERFKCENCGTEENLHIQRFKGYYKAITCYLKLCCNVIHCLLALVSTVHNKNKHISITSLSHDQSSHFVLRLVPRFQAQNAVATSGNSKFEKRGVCVCV